MTTRPDESRLCSAGEGGVLTETIEATEQHHRDIRRGILSVGTFVLLGKLAAAIKEMVVAWRYGVSSDVDVYLFLFNLVNWPIALWLGLLTLVLVPVLAKSVGDTSALDLFRAELIGRIGVAGWLAAAILAAVLLVVLGSSLSGLPVTGVSTAYRILSPMVLLVPCGWLIGLFSVMVMAAGRHANTLLESVPAAVIAGLVALTAKPSIELLAWATLAGYICHVVCLAITLRPELPRPRITALAPQWREFWGGFSIMLLGQFLSSLTTVADQFFAARLSAGALASMGYSQRILSLVIGLGVTAVGRATIPVLARSSGTGHRELHSVIMRWARLVFAGGVVAAVAGWIVAPWGVRLLYQRGAFTAHATQEVVEVFRAGLLQMPFNFSAVLLFYALAGRRKYAAITVVAGIVLVAKLIMNSLTVARWGTQGLMASTAVMYAIMMFSYHQILNKSES